MTRAALLEARQPNSSGGDPGATKSVYYTSGANASDAACGNNPVYAGYLCKSTPQGAGGVRHKAGFNSLWPASGVH